MKYHLLIVLLLSCHLIQAQTPELLVAGEFNQSRFAGAAVAIENNVAAVGDPFGEGTEIRDGFVNVYELSNDRWRLAAQLSSDQVQNNAFFGGKVKVSDGRVIVTAAAADRVFNGQLIAEAGMVFVYEKVNGQWTEAAELIPSVVERHDRFGTQLTANGSMIFVSKADNNQTGSSSSGGVFVFEKRNNIWVETQLITATGDVNAMNKLGLLPMSSDGETLVVPNVISRESDNYAEINIYQLLDNQWQLIQVLSSPTALPDEYGSAVSVRGDRLLVAAVNHMQSGRVYLYQKTDGLWIESHRFDAESMVEFNQQFGSDVAVGIDQVVIGARHQTYIGGELNEGQVFVYNSISEDWPLSYVLEAEGEQGRNDFGWAVAIDEQSLIIGSPNTANTGAAYVAQIPINASVVNINAGLNGTWFNQETAGQGLFLDVSRALDFSFLGWFTYNDETVAEALGPVGADGQRWLVGAGDINQVNSSITYDLYYSHDGLFDDPREVITINPEAYGSLTIEFQSCSTAWVTYHLFAADISGSYPIARPVAGSDSLCADLSGDINVNPFAANDFDYRLNGAWFNPATPGQGFFIDKFKGVDVAFMGWFTYDTVLRTLPTPESIGAPGQRWLVGTGAVDETDANVLNYQLYYSYGGLFDDPLDVSTIDPSSYGNLRIEFIDCAYAEVEYSIEGSELAGGFSMVRAVPNGQSCVAADE